ncbi:hypothetical protein LY76DRAFT_154425 [Colletotrichum caudatum]|nr:hypothetical protein LY76DRAFT_154425 [Colletotrichum caudatum]
MCPVCAPPSFCGVGMGALCVVCGWCGADWLPRLQVGGQNSVVLRLVAAVPLTSKRDPRVFRLGYPSRARTVAGTVRVQRVWYG